MNKRRAKRWACHVTRNLIDSYMDVGQPGEECNDAGGNGRGWTPGDESALVEAFEDLKQELQRRGITAGDGGAE